MSALPQATNQKAGGRGGGASKTVILDIAEKDTYQDTETFGLSSMYCFVFSERGDASEFTWLKNYTEPYTHTGPLF